MNLIMRTKLWLVFQATWFNVVWFLCVVGKNEWLVYSMSAIVVYFFISPCRREDVKILPLALLGLGIDLSLTFVGVFSFNAPPIWLAVLWFAFVINFGHSFSFLTQISNRWLWFFGAVPGLYSYLLSWKLDAVEFPLGVIETSVILFIVWSVLLPVLVKADGFIREPIQ